MQGLTPNIMIDIETMGIETNSALISLGAVRFDPHATVGEVIDSFYVAIDLTSSVNAGLKISPSTVMWWMNKDRDAAREQLLSENHVDIESALIGFADWYGPESLPTWGNGATFDNVIVANAMKLCGLPVPWKYYHERCFRTLKNLVPLVNAVPQPAGVAHHALYDALYQTYQTQMIFKKLDRMEIAEDMLTHPR